MRNIEYNRDLAVSYAREWAFRRNSKYYNFNGIGGDCTNFASQCLFAGIGVMNYTRDIGWYYRSLTDRAAAWSGVEYFYNFLIGNATGIGNGGGPYAEEVRLSQVKVGDFIQFGRATGDFYHTPIITGFRNGVPLLSAHSNDAFNRPLTSYRYEKLRCIHILGGRDL